MNKFLKCLLSLMICLSLINFVPAKAATASVNKEVTLTLKDHSDGPPNELKYSFTLAEDSVVSVELSSTKKAVANKTFDITANIFAQDTSKLPQNTAGIFVNVSHFDNSNKSYEVCLPKGTYSFTIRYAMCEAGRKVTYKINTKKVNDNFAEHGYSKNDSTSKAQSISLYKQYNSALMAEDMSDYYKVQVPTKAKYDIVLKSSLVSYDVSVYKKEGNSWVSKYFKSIEDGEGYSKKKVHSLTLDPGTYVFCIADFPGLDTYNRVESGYYQFSFGVNHSFKDLDANSWYYATVLQAYQKGLMTGTDSTHFSPNANMSRAMVATVLHRIAGSKSVAYQPLFKDVKKGEWYATAIIWAAQNKVVNGYASGNFGVSDPITREQMCAMCMKFVTFMNGKVPTQRADLSKFKDQKAITKNMKASVEWAVAVGILSGSSDGYINPTGKATRAQCAKMLLQLSNVVGK